MAKATGVEKRQALVNAGFSAEELDQWEADTRRELSDAGFSSVEADEYFGIQKPDMTPMKKYFEENFRAHQAAGATREPAAVKEIPGGKPEELQAPAPKNQLPGAKDVKKPEQADTFLEAIEAGWQMSVTGLVGRGESPDMVLPEHAPMFARIASQVGTLAGDVPAMVAGAFGGSAAGTAVAPGPGTVIGGGAGAFALPAAIRTTLMQHYEKGDIKDFSDFWERSSAVFLETMKAGVVGGATAGVGGVAGKALAPVAAPAIRAGGKAAAEVATMVTVGKALEGEVPNAQDFLEAGILVGGLHGSVKVAGKLRGIYAKTGVRPEQVAEHAQKDPVVMQELLSSNREVPSAYEGIAKKAEGAIGEGDVAVAVEVKPPKEMLEQSSTLAAEIPTKIEFKPIQEPTQKPTYDYAPMDVNQPTGGKVFYHGTKAGLVKMSEADVYGRSSVRNLYGEGLYLTDSPEVARAYADKKGKGASGKVLAAELKDLKLIDIEKPLPEEFRAVINDLIEQHGGEKIGKEDKGVLGYDALKEAMAEAGIYESEAIEVWQSLNAELSQLGIDGIRHEGGNRVGGKGKHNVVVLFEDIGVDKDGKPVGRRLKDKIIDRDASEFLDKIEFKPIQEPMPRPTPRAEPVRTEAEKLVESRIVPSSGQKPEITWDKAYTAAIDELHPIKQFSKLLAGEKTLSVKEDPYSLARLSRGAYGKADQFLELSPFKFETLENTGSKPLKKILEPFKEDLQGFRNYAVSRRVLELSGRGVETGVDVGAAKIAARDGKVRYEKAFQELVQYQNDTLAYLKDSGIISEKAFESMQEANKSYVPFFRLMEEGGGGKTAGRGLQVKNPVRAIKGSERQIIDPIESIIKNTYLYITLAERNRVMRSMAELAEKSEMGPEFMEKVKTPMKPIEVKSEEVAKFFEEHGIEANAEAFTIFRPGALRLSGDEIPVFRDGKMEVYKVAPELAAAVKALDREGTHFLMKLLAFPAKTLRAGAVLSPDLMLRNVVRDQMTAFTLSQNKYFPVVDSLRGLGSLLKKDEHYQNWLKSGGANSALVAIDRQYIEQNVFKLSKETGLIDKTWNVVRSPLELMRISSEILENSTRLGDFKNAMKGKQGAEAVFKAGLDAREVTLDFARIGAQTRAINAITAFWNVGVQGLDRTVRGFKDNPVGMTTKVTASITLPSVLLWWANKDDPRWQEIPRWQKDLFWIVMTKDHIYRIPKPFEVGVIFGSLPERTLEAYFSENPKAFKEFEKTLLEGVTPNYLPTFATPVIEHFANRSTFTGSSIVPAHLEGILPEYQYTEYTTETGKMLGKFVAAVPGQRNNPFASPAILENYIRSWSGNLGMYALKLADQALEKTGVIPDPVKPASTLADLPVVKAFVIRYPSSSAQSIQDFYDRYTEQKTIADTIRHLARSGDFENMTKELTLQENQINLVKLDGIREALTAQGKFIRLVHKNPEMAPDEKRQIIDGIYFSMIEMAKNGNMLIDELDKALSPKSNGK